MSSASSAATALRAAEQQIEVSARNVANSNTDEYKSKVARAHEGDHGGVKVTLSEDTSPGTKYNGPDGEVAETSNVDYANEGVNQVRARALYEANLASLRAYEETYETTIDLMV
jgi:flagellar basal body rod protein FlgG